jgi:hypothetical protein
MCPVPRDLIAFQHDRRRHIALVVKRLTEGGRTPEQKDALRRLFSYSPPVTPTGPGRSRP